MIYLAFAYDGPCDHSDDGWWWEDVPEDDRPAREYVPNRGPGTDAEKEVAVKVEDAMGPEVKRAAGWMARLMRENPELSDELLMDATAQLLEMGLDPATPVPISVVQAWDHDCGV